MNKLFLISLLLLFSASAHAKELKPFTTDGCSSFPDGTFEHNKLWLDCCTAHDYSYWRGGTYQERLDSDLALRECVSEVGEEAVALLMLAGVRVGGSPYFPSEFRWGYGWTYPKFYGELTSEELEQINNETKL